MRLFEGATIILIMSATSLVNQAEMSGPTVEKMSMECGGCGHPVEFDDPGLDCGYTGKKYRDWFACWSKKMDLARMRPVMESDKEAVCDIALKKIGAQKVIQFDHCPEFNGGLITTESMRFDACKGQNPDRSWWILAPDKAFVMDYFGTYSIKCLVE